MSIRLDQVDQFTDALSRILRRMHLTAEIYLQADFCGAWAVDTSGSRRVPFHLVGAGQCWLHMENEPPRVLSSGDLVVFPSDHKHILSSEAERPPAELLNAPKVASGGQVTNLVCGFFEFTNPASWPLLDSLPDVLVLDLRETSTLADTGMLIRLIISELKQQAPGYSLAVNELALILFVHILRFQIQHQHAAQAGMLAALFDAKIGLALNRMHAEPGADWSLDTLAKLCGMSRAVFAKRFRELMKMTPMHYLTAVRMHEATELLADGKLSVARIAELTGYTSEAAFRKAYKNTTGKPPGKIRKTSIGSEPAGEHG